MNKLLRRLAILPIRIYQKIISPIIPAVARKRPTFTENMPEPIQTHAIFKGLYLGTRRLLRCHPWGGSGYDPVPPKEKPDKKG